MPRGRYGYCLSLAQASRSSPLVLQRTCRTQTSQSRRGVWLAQRCSRLAIPSARCWVPSLERAGNRYRRAGVQDCCHDSQKIARYASAKIEMIVVQKCHHSAVAAERAESTNHGSIPLAVQDRTHCHVSLFFFHSHTPIRGPEEAPMPA